MIAIVNFRTLANGSYRYMAVKRRCYWRVLLVRDVNQDSAAEARRIACEHNAERLGAAIADNAFAMGMKDDEQQPE